jgi:hypothetical protein
LSFLLVKKRPRKFGQQLIETETRAGRGDGLGAAGLDLLAELVGGVKADCLKAAITQQLAVSLSQAHRGPERDGLSERMVHAVGDDKFYAGVRRGESERKRILRGWFDYEDLRAGPWRRR